MRCRSVRGSPANTSSTLWHCRGKLHPHKPLPGLAALPEHPLQLRRFVNGSRVQDTTGSPVPNATPSTVYAESNTGVTSYSGCERVGESSRGPVRGSLYGSYEWHRHTHTDTDTDTRPDTDTRRDTPSTSQCHTLPSTAHQITEHSPNST